MTTKTINLYTFDELSDKAKEKARDWWRESESQDFGSDPYFMDPVEAVAKYLGINFRTHGVRLMSGKERYESNIYWTLHVQGAGASYDATYSYNKGGTKALKGDFTADKELHRIADELQAIQRKYFYTVTASIKSDSRGHFLEVESEAERGRIVDEDSKSLEELFRDFAHWIYKYVDEEYDSRMEDSYVDYSILANEYTFTEDGERES